MYGNVAVLGISTGLGTSTATLAATGASPAPFVILAALALVLGLALTWRARRMAGLTAPSPALSPHHQLVTGQPSPQEEPS